MKEKAGRQTRKRAAVSLLRLHVFSINSDRFTSQTCGFTGCDCWCSVCWKPTQRTFSWDTGNYVFWTCSAALWAFVALSLLILSIGLDVSQEQATALIWPPQTPPPTNPGQRECGGCGVNPPVTFHPRSSPNPCAQHQATRCVNWLQIWNWLLPSDGKPHVG